LVAKVLSAVAPTKPLPPAAPTSLAFVRKKAAENFGNPWLLKRKLIRNGQISYFFKAQNNSQIMKIK
jgi:hypothetical protein